MKTLKPHLLATILPAAALVLNPAAWAADPPAGDQEPQSNQSDQANRSDPSSPQANRDAAAPASDSPATAGNQPAASPASTVSTMPSQRVGDRVAVATDEAEDRLDRKLAGRNVEGNDGDGLGEIKDFLVDPGSGKIAFVMVESGGIAGIGGKLRLVPTSALKPGDKDDTYRIEMTEDRWEQIAPLDDDQAKSDDFTLSDAQRREVLGHFGEASDPASATYTASLTQRLVRASEFHGKDVRSGGREIGKIEGVVIDLEQGTAQGLLDADRDFAGTTEKLLVPLSEFELAGDREPVVTTLTRTEIVQATGASQISSSSSGTLPMTGRAANDTSVATTDATKQGLQASATGQHPGDQQPDLGLSGTSSQARTANAGGTTLPRDSAERNAADNTRSSATQASTSGPASASANQTLAQADTQSAQAGTPSSDAASTTSQQKQTDSPPFKNEQGADVATATPSSPSSKSPGADLAIDSSARQSAAGPAPSDSGSKTTPAITDNTAGATAATTTPSRTSDTEPPLSPTGRTSADQSPSADGTLMVAAQSVRTALDEDASMAQLAVSIVPEGNRLVLRGTVPDEATRRKVEQTAERAAGGKEIDSQLEVGTK